MSAVRIVAAGDAVLVAEFEDRIDAAVNARAIGLASALRDAAIAGVRDIVPTFRSVAVYFDPLATDVAKLTARMRDTAENESVPDSAAPTLVEIPVCYDREFGMDLEAVMQFAGAASRENVIAWHTAPIYRVFMLGFVPGFAYLGTVDPRIALPRRATPRLLVPAGSVGIAGQQTGIYPRETPGGWNIVGRTPTQMLSPARSAPSLLKAGDHVRLRRIDRRDFDRIAAEQERAS